MFLPAPLQDLTGYNFMRPTDIAGLSQRCVLWLDKWLHHSKEVALPNAKFTCVIVGNLSLLQTDQPEHN